MTGRSTSSSDVDALFRLPLGEFTAARNALVAELKKSGRQAEANEAKALTKPSVSAWVVNQLYWRHRESFDKLIEAGDRLRRAQGSQKASDSAREPVVARREAVTGLAKTAAEILREGDHGTTHDLLRRVTSTLEALSSYGSLPGAPVAGRLTDDLEPPGFEAVMGLLPEGAKQVAGQARRSAHSPRAEPATRPPRPTVRLVTTDRRDKKEQKAELAAAKAAVREAERALSVARKQAERADGKLNTAATAAKAIDGQRAELEQQLDRSSKDAEAAQRRTSEAQANATEATQVAEAAERELELARRHLEQISQD